MNSKKITPFFKKIFLFTSVILILHSCGSWDPPDVKDSPINDADMRKRNIEEGRGITLLISSVASLRHLFRLFVSVISS